MDVILLEKIRNLGSMGDQVSVRPGYGRNFLIPQGKAVAATKKNVAEFEVRRAELEKQAAQVLQVAQQRADAIAKLTIEIQAKVGDEGKLYGSVGTNEIADAITNAGVEIKKSEVSLPTGALRFSGEYDVELQLHTDIVVPIKINIVAE